MEKRDLKFQGEGGWDMHRGLGKSPIRRPKITQWIDNWLQSIQNKIDLRSKGNVFMDGIGALNSQYSINNQ